MESPKYNGAQQELYEIGRIGWTNCKNNLPTFSSFSPRYKPEYIIEAMLDIAAAEALPSDNVRSGISEDSRILLTRAADDSLAKWRGLKRYIVEAFDKDRSKPMLKAAGESRYSEAARYSWQSVKKLVNDGSQFIKDHNGELVADDNMPLDFSQSFDASMNTFTDLQVKFFGSVGENTQNTQNKIIINNRIYSMLIKMLKDGQEIFSTDEGLKQQFVLTNLKSIVSGISSAGLRGIVTDAGTGLTIVGAAVATANKIYKTTTDETGYFEMKGLPAGIYTVTIAAEGFASQTMDMEVKTGTVSTKNVVLVGTA